MRTKIALLMLAVAVAAVPTVARAEAPVTSPAMAPVSTGDKVRLGYSAAQVLDRLGLPSFTTTYDAYVVWHYTDQGMFLMVNETQGVVGIFFVTRDAGRVDGLRVGDDFDKVMDKWGSPTAWNGDIAIFAGDDVHVLVEVSIDQVTLIGMTLASIDGLE